MSMVIWFWAWFIGIHCFDLHAAMTCTLPRCIKWSLLCGIGCDAILIVYYMPAVTCTLPHHIKLYKRSLFCAAGGLLLARRASSFSGKVRRTCKSPNPLRWWIIGLIAFQSREMMAFVWDVYTLACWFAQWRWWWLCVTCLWPPMHYCSLSRACWRVLTVIPLAHSLFKWNFAVGTEDKGEGYYGCFEGMSQ